MQPVEDSPDPEARSRGGRRERAIVMTFITRALCSLVLVGSTLLLLRIDPVARELVVYLTWQHEDTSRTMAVNFLHLGRTLDDPVVRYAADTRPADAAGASDRVAAWPSTLSGMPCKVFHADLTGLLPATSYRFTIEDAGGYHSEERRFRTLPDDDRPLRIVVGGDMGTGWAETRLVRRAAGCHPDAALIGGDIAYADADPSKIGHWLVWLSAWSREGVDGTRCIPLILAIANHDVDDEKGP